MLALIKRRLSTQPLRRRLLWVVMFVVLTTITSTLLFLYWKKNIQQRDDFIHANLALAKLVSEFTVFPLVFDDKSGVEEQLSPLFKDPRVVYLRLEKGSDIVSKYDPFDLDEKLPAGLADQEWVWGVRHFYFKVPIMQNDRQLGILKGAFRLDELKKQQWQELRFMLLVLGIALVCSYSMALSLRRFIMAPITRLEKHTRQSADKSHRGDLLLPAPQTNDEISRLYEAFNLLMQRVQQREAEILRFNNELEIKIGQRTEELRAKSEELDNYFNYALDLFLIADFSGIIRKINPQWQEVLGYATAEMEARPFMQFVHPDDWAKTQEAMRVLSERHPLTDFVNRYRHQDGSYRWIEWSCIPKHGLIYAAARDITESKQAEEHLRLASSVYQNSSEAMVVADPENNILSVNPAFSTITGYGPDEVVGKSPNLLDSGKHDAEFYQNVWLQLERTGYWQGEIQIRHKNGETYVQWLTLNNVYDDDGRVIRRVALFYDITEKKKTEEQIWFQANYDPLTNLPNRRLFADRLQHEIRKVKREKQYLVLFFLDLDRFKEVNDTFGHRMGDALLVDAAKRIRGCIRETDTVARLGGDEFTVIVSELADVGDVDRIAQAVIDVLSQPYFFDNRHVYVSASIGIAVYPSDAEDAEDLVRYADQAMYAAKNKGRNGFCYFTPSMQEASQKRMLILTDLHSAIQRGELQVYYQPILNLQTGRIYKAEALIRWRHPQRGLINPAEFIPIAEEHGLIQEIGEWVFRQVADQLQSLQAEHQTRFQISVNVSPLQFQGLDNYLAHWPVYLEQNGVCQDNVIIEITEGLLLEANDKVAEQLLHFARNNMQIAIDDFGTGYSSLSYLKKFDIDYLKVDKSFIFHLAADSDDLALTKAIVIMAHQLGLKVIAEGVETELQRQLLMEMGCDYAQGYLIAKPMPADLFSDFLRDRG